MICDKDSILYEDFKNGKVFRNGKPVTGDLKYYTEAVREEQVGINDDQEMSLIDEGAMNPYEVYHSKKYLCSGGGGSDICDLSFAGPQGSQFKSTGHWLKACPVFHS